jgi:hypothetical protein
MDTPKAPPISNGFTCALAVAAGAVRAMAPSRVERKKRFTLISIVVDGALNWSGHPKILGALKQI